VVTRTNENVAAGRSQDTGHRYTSSDVPPRLPVADFSSMPIEADTAPSNLPIANEVRTIDKAHILNTHSLFTSSLPPRGHSEMLLHSQILPMTLCH